MAELFDDWEKRIDSAITEAKSAILRIQALERLLDEAQDLLSYFTERYYNEAKYPQEDAVQVAGKIGRQYLDEYGSEAIVASEEFDLPDFIRNFRKALQLAPIQILPMGYDCYVSIDMDSVAGTLEDYGQAVDKARQELGVGPKHGRGYTSVDSEGKTGVKNPVFVASKFWAEKYYKPEREGINFTHPNPKRKINIEDYKAKYRKTIALRVKNFKGYAPYWKLIDQGNVLTKVSSDMGGIPYPIIRPTRFIQRTIDVIKREYTDQYINNLRLGELLSSSISELEKVIILIQKKIEELGNLEEILKTAIETRLGQKTEFVDPKQLSNLISKIISNQEVLEKEFLGNLPPGSRRDPRIRIRTKALQKIVEAFRNR